MTEHQTTDIAIDTPQPPEDSSLPPTLGQVPSTDEEATQEALSKSPYTLTTIQRRRPKLLELAIRLLSEGCSQRETAKTTGLSRPVIAQIRTNYEEQIGNLRDESALKARNIAAQTLDLMMERIEAGDIPPNLLPVYFGVLTEKAELLTGQATSRQETTITDNRIPIEELYSSLRKSDPANIDISQETE